VERASRTGLEAWALCITSRTQTTYAAQDRAGVTVSSKQEATMRKDKGPDAHDIFVSYSREDSKLVDEVVEHLSLDPPRKSDGCFAALAGW
jgi:hypothetical protein